MQHSCGLQNAVRIILNVGEFFFFVHCWFGCRLLVVLSVVCGSGCVLVVVVCVFGVVVFVVVLLLSFLFVWFAATAITS